MKTVNGICDTVFIGRWLHLVLYGYVEECRSAGHEPFSHSLTVTPDDKLYGCFLKAVTNARDRLIQETSTLMVVTGLLASISLQLIDPKDGLHTAVASTRTGLATTSFFCSVLQLILGVAISMCSCRTPRSFLCFLFTGEFLTTTSLVCFLTAILSLLAATMLLFWDVLQVQLGATSRTVVFVAFAAASAVVLPFTLFVDYKQRRYIAASRDVPVALLHCLEPFLAFNPQYDVATDTFGLDNSSLNWITKQAHWHPLRLYIERRRARQAVRIWWRHHWDSPELDEPAGAATAAGKEAGKAKVAAKAAATAAMAAQDASKAAGQDTASQGEAEKAMQAAVAEACKAGRSVQAAVQAAVRAKAMALAANGGSIHMAQETAKFAAAAAQESNKEAAKALVVATAASAEATIWQPYGMHGSFSFTSNGNAPF